MDNKHCMNITATQPKVIIVGSSSIDLVLNAGHHPKENETLMAEKLEIFFGGKGANQAVAAARLGASVYFIGCVGMDPYGQQIMRNLVDEGINVGFVEETEDASTGTAYVTAAQGTNTIIVVPAANYCLKAEHVASAERYFATADIILVQLEIPMPVIEFTVELAKKYGKKVGVYAAPARKLPEAVKDYSSFIVAKSKDLSVIFEDESVENLLQKYPNKLFVRDDTNSTTYFNGEEMKYYRNDHDDHLHKMGMGDAFTAGFAIAYCHGNNIHDCVQFGNSVSKKVAGNRGSQRGLPYLKNLIKG